MNMKWANYLFIIVGSALAFIHISAVDVFRGLAIFLAGFLVGWGLIGLRLMALYDQLDSLVEASNNVLVHATVLAEVVDDHDLEDEFEKRLRERAEEASEMREWADEDPIAHQVLVEDDD